MTRPPKVPPPGRPDEYPSARDRILTAAAADPAPGCGYCGIASCGFCGDGVVHHQWECPKYVSRWETERHRIRSIGTTGTIFLIVESFIAIALFLAVLTGRLR